MSNQDTSTEALEEFLKAITLSALARNAHDSEDITELLEATGLAVATRKIVDCVQFEEVWEEEVDADVEASNILFMFITFRLSPRVCEAAIEQGHALNELTWTLVLPDPDSLDLDERPDSSTELLMLAEIDVGIEASSELETLKSIIVLEEPRLN
jgi:hypothetical protein